MCACVSACESVGVGGGGAVFYSGFVEEKIDPHGKQVPGQRKQPSHVRTRVPILPVTVRSTLSTFSPIVGRPPESFKAGVVGGGHGGGREMPAVLRRLTTSRRSSTDAPQRSHHGRSLPLSPTEQTRANYIRR